MFLSCFLEYTIKNFCVIYFWMKMYFVQSLETMKEKIVKKNLFRSN